MTNGHTRGDSVRIDNQIRLDALRGERHILRRVGDTAGTLLPVTRSKLVTDLRYAHGTHTDLRELVAVLVRTQHHLIDDTGLTGAQECGSVTLLISVCTRKNMR